VTSSWFFFSTRSVLYSSERVHNSVTFYTLQKHNIMAKKMTSLNFETSEIIAQNKSRSQVTIHVNINSATSVVQQPLKQHT